MVQNGNVVAYVAEELSGTTENRVGIEICGVVINTTSSLEQLATKTFNFSNEEMNIKW